MWLWVGLGIGAVVLIAIFLFLRARSRGGKMTSLVLFMKEPRLIDAQTVRRAASKAFGLRVGSTTEEENFVVQMSPEMMPVRIHHLPMGFIYSPKRYMEKPDESDLGSMDPRLKKVILDHTAWCSVDLIGDAPAAAKQEVYRHIGRLLAEFVDDNCLGIYSPEMDDLMYNHPGLKERLRSEDPLSALEMTESPVVQAGYDDDALKATVVEAQERWPEFAAAFAKRKTDKPFGVKLKFDDGEESEFMWIAVELIQGDDIRGTLDNAPMTVKNIREGAAVNAKRADVLDWMYEDDAGEMRGAFSLKVLTGEG